MHLLYSMHLNGSECSINQGTTSDSAPDSMLTNLQSGSGVNGDSAVIRMALQDRPGPINLLGK